VGGLEIAVSNPSKAPGTILGVVVRRLLQLVPLLIGITLGGFFLLRLLPGDPALEILQLYATPELVDKLHAELGLDRSIPEQYLIFLRRVLQGDLGTSYVFHQPVTLLVVEQIPPTLALVGLATALSIVIALPLALLAALRQGSAYDRVIHAILIVNVGVPGPWIGLLFLLFFAATLRLFPVGGYGRSTAEHLYHLFLPSLTLAVTAVPVVLRALRTSLIEQLRAEHVAMARAKGLPWRVVLVRHVLRNAMIPSVTILGMNAGFLVGATVFVEVIYGVPGLGQLLFNAIRFRDYPTVQAVTMTFAVLAVLIQLATDVVHMLLDPRIRARAS
jgi:peptide/nickel transport system permease protein